jgi:hypothetical protein
MLRDIFDSLVDAVQPRNPAAHRTPENGRTAPVAFFPAVANPIALPACA